MASEGVQGRWTLIKDPGTISALVRGPSTHGPVPVVPCDEAAVERAARHLYARDAKRSIGLSGGEAIYERVASEYRAQARIALEAAASE